MTAAYSDTYTAMSGQVLTVEYDKTTDLNIYVKVYYDEQAEVTAGFDTAIKQIIVDGQSGLYPGQEVTAQYFSELLADFTLVTITGVEVSNDGVTYGRTATVNGNKYPVLATARELKAKEAAMAATVTVTATA